MALPKLRDKKGRFMRGWSLNDNGYPRYHSGPYRGKYVHRVQASLMLDRPLKRDEDVHHKNGNRQDFRARNLKVLNHVDHGYVSSKQRWFVNTLLEQRYKDWYAEYDIATEAVA